MNKLDFTDRPAHKGFSGPTIAPPSKTHIDANATLEPPHWPHMKEMEVSKERFWLSQAQENALIEECERQHARAKGERS